jgi:hypothetical protein
VNTTNRLRSERDEEQSRVQRRDCTIQALDDEIQELTNTTTRLLDELERERVRNAELNRTITELDSERRKDSRKVTAMLAIANAKKDLDEDLFDSILFTDE